MCATRRAIPIPVSRTPIIACPSCVRRLTVTTPFAGVNLFAFWSRFPTTWAMRVGSASTQAGSEGGRGAGRSRSGRRWNEDPRRSGEPRRSSRQVLALESDLPVRHARRVEQVVHEVAQMLRLAADDVLGVLACGLSAGTRSRRYRLFRMGASGLRSSWDSTAMKSFFRRSNSRNIVSRSRTSVRRCSRSLKKLNRRRSARPAGPVPCGARRAGTRIRTAAPTSCA